MPKLEYWICEEKRLLSFHPAPGFRHIRPDAPEQHWQTILGYLDKGYRVQ